MTDVMPLNERPALPSAARETTPDDWTLSEQPMMADGQLGSALLEGGPEGANPEGSSNIARVYEHPRDGAR
jgi:hypothetical protein